MFGLCFSRPRGTLRGPTFFCGIFLSCISLLSHGQSLRDHLQKGDRYYQRKDYRSALAYFEEALALDPDNFTANYKAGVASVDQRKFTQAISCFEKVLEISGDVDADVHYRLGLAYQNDHRYAEAIDQYKALRAKNKQLAPIATRKIAECIAADSLMRLPALATVRILEGALNSDFSEFTPLILPDEQTIIFSSDRPADPNGRGGARDVYVSSKRGRYWIDPVKIVQDVNAIGNEVAVSISPDGTTLFLHYEDGSGDIYVSTRQGARWSAPVPLNRFINHPDYNEAAACLSADGQRLYFSSNRPGGKGGFDIYVSEKGANGQWGRPSNLGSPVNTRGDELSPFIDAEGTLYFSSNGHATLGDHDLFRTVRNDGRWSIPENLGYPVNTSGYEGSLFLSRDGRTGYFTSRRKPGKSDADIYSIVFFPEKEMENFQADLQE